VKHDSPLSELETLKLIYHDILNGYTLDNSGTFVKHFSEVSFAKILTKKLSLIIEYEKQGLPKTSDREKEIIEQGLWEKEKDDRIIQLKFAISDNEKYALGMVIPQQKEAILKIIKDNKIELANLLHQRDGIIGPTREKFADREVENHFIVELFYKDSDLKQKCFSDEEIAEMENEDLEKLKKILNRALSKIQETHITKIACLPFFLNTLGLTKERPEHFLGVPVHKLTFNQHNLISTGLKNLSITSNSEGQPPNLLSSSIDDLVKWYDLNYSILLSKSGKGGAGGGITMTNTDVVKS
jgi:hypothetical protein